jgi:hypothetical protein
MTELSIDELRALDRETFRERDAAARAVRRRSAMLLTATIATLGFLGAGGSLVMADPVEYLGGYIAGLTVSAFSLAIGLLWGANPAVQDTGS